MTDGFYVDVGAIRSAIQGIQDTLDTTDITSVRDLDRSEDQLGHEGLADALKEFSGRWELGVVHLRQDASQIAGALAAAMNSYQQADEQTGQRLGGGGPG